MLRASIRWLGLLALAQHVVGQNWISTHPGSIPLAVRSPYFNAWLPTHANSSELPAIADAWPRLWHNDDVGWMGFIRVDGESYQWLGVGGVPSADTTASYITPTQTIFSLQAGPVDFNVTFLNPVEPVEWTRQSIPFAYISLDIVSRDGDAHSIQVYTDVTGEWLSPIGRNTSTVRTTTTRTGDVVYHTMQRADSEVMEEEDSEYLPQAKLLLAAKEEVSTSTRTGPASHTRASFTMNGRLDNSEDISISSISPTYPVLAIAIDLGDISRTSSPTPATFVLGIMRDPVVQYQQDEGGSIARQPYFLTRWPTFNEAIDEYMNDFTGAASRANALDTKIMSDARTRGSSAYADLVALALRQTVASVDITCPPLEDGKTDAQDIKAFMKDVGISSRTNPIDTIYASLPAFLYLNASLVGALLDPLLEIQDRSGSKSFAGPDLGAQYPTAIRNESESAAALGVDSSASMLILALAHARKSGESYLLTRHYDLFRIWAGYLVDNALRPPANASADGLSQENNSNVALKGILGLYAMGQINKALESEGKSSAETKVYDDTARQYYTEWLSLALSSGHIASGYGQTGSWTFAHSLYYASLLGADFVTTELYDRQTAFHKSQIASSPDVHGFGYDSNDVYTVKSHWMMLTAATMTDVAVRDSFIDIIHRRTFMRGGVLPPFAAHWDVRSGVTLGGRASPAQGAMFALLALALPDVPIRLGATGGIGGGPASSSGGGRDSSDPGTGTGGSKANVGAIVGGVVGGVAVIALAVLAFIFARRRRRRGEAAGADATQGNASSAASPDAAATETTDKAKPLLVRLLQRNRPRSGSHSSTESGGKEEEISAPPMVVPFDAATAPSGTVLPNIKSQQLNSSAAATTTTPQHPASFTKTRLPQSADRVTAVTAPPIFVKSAMPEVLGASMSQSTLRDPSLSYTSPSSASQSPPSEFSGGSSVAGTGTGTLSTSDGQGTRSGRRDSISKAGIVIVEERSGGLNTSVAPTTTTTTAALLPPPPPPTLRHVESETDELRAEVLALRREMEAIRAHTQGSTPHLPLSGSDEPPPSYSA